MFCPHCHNKIPDGSNICPLCYSNLAGMKPQASAAPQDPYDQYDSYDPQMENPAPVRKSSKSGRNGKGVKSRPIPRAAAAAKRTQIRRR